MGYEDERSARVKEQVAKWGAQGSAVRFRLEETGGKIAHDTKPPNIASFMWTFTIGIYIIQLTWNNEICKEITELVNSD